MLLPALTAVAFACWQFQLSKYFPNLPIDHTAQLFQSLANSAFHFFWKTKTAVCAFYPGHGQKNRWVSLVQQALKQVQTGGSKNAANTPWFHFFLFIFDGRFGTIIKRKNTSQTPTDFSAVHFGSRHFSFARIFFVVHNRHPILIDRRTTAPPCFENPACQKA